MGWVVAASEHTARERPAAGATATTGGGTQQAGAGITLGVKFGLSPSQGSRRIARGAGACDESDAAASGLSQRSQESVRESTGRSGTWQPAAQADPGSDSTHAVPARTSNHRRYPD
jgi:hypothetical protein